MRNLTGWSREGRSSVKWQLTMPGPRESRLAAAEGATAEAGLAKWVDKHYATLAPGEWVRLLRLAKVSDIPQAALAEIEDGAPEAPVLGEGGEIDP